MRWKDIPGYEGIYKVSDTGKIMSLNYKGMRKSQLLVQGINSRGYLYVDLKDKTFVVHRLVCMAFINNPNKKPYVNHKNGIKTDNRLSNLEWCTHKENMIHKCRTLGQMPIWLTKNGKDNHQSKKVYQYDLSGKYLRCFDTGRQAAKYVGISASNISKCALGQRGHAAGYIWKFKKDKP